MPWDSWWRVEKSMDKVRDAETSWTFTNSKMSPRAYFRIQRKCQICSKSAPNLGNTNWTEQVIQLHMLLWLLHFLQFLISFSEVLRIPGNVTGNLTSFFKRNLQRYKSVKV